MSGICGWSSGNQSAGACRLATWARVNWNLEPGTLSSLALSSTAGGADGAGGGNTAGGGVVVPHAQGIGGASAACTGVANPAAAPSDNTAAVTKNLVMFLPYFLPGLSRASCNCAAPRPASSA